MKKVTIVQRYKKDFEALLDAAAHGALCLMECWDPEREEEVAMLCIVWREGDMENVFPVAVMMHDASKRLVPPNPDGGFSKEGWKNA